MMSTFPSSGFKAWRQFLLHKELSCRRDRWPRSSTHFKIQPTNHLQVHIRASQQKFTAVYNGLEIIRCSRFSLATLNRQTITILSCLGVEDKVFLKMLADQLANYQTAMENDEVAISLLLRYIDDNQMTINIATMLRNGFHGDPFVSSLLHLWRAWSIKLLKEKAKIIVEDGAFLLGCADETNTLKGYKTESAQPGEQYLMEELPQIFLQVPDKTGKYVVIEGVCLVGRNPSLHPGDLRVVMATDVPALYHLRGMYIAPLESLFRRILGNVWLDLSAYSCLQIREPNFTISPVICANVEPDVVVFPMNGDRDIPSMCSGGDLDGDDFFVIWDKNLMPKEWNCIAMNYQAPKPIGLRNNRAVEMKDVIKFFVTFMKNDSLPTIAHAHLAQSDFLDDSVQDLKCLEVRKTFILFRLAPKNPFRRQSLSCPDRKHTPEPGCADFCFKGHTDGSCSWLHYTLRPSIMLRQVNLR